MKRNHRRFLHLNTCILHYFYFYGRYNDYRHSLASTALRIGIFCWNECLQPFQTDEAQKFHHKSNEPTANPIFAYFKFLTNLRAAMRPVVPITNSYLPAGRSRFRICPPKSTSSSGKSGPHLIPWLFLGPADRQTEKQTDHVAIGY